MNFLSSTEQVSAQKPVAVSEIFSHLDADNAVSGTLSLYEFDFDNNHVFQMDEILFCGQWVILGATIFSVREKKRVSGMLGCIDEGQKVLPVIIFKGLLKNDFFSGSNGGGS